MLYRMPVEKRKSRVGTTKKSWDMLNESKVPTIAFMKRIEVHDVKLANVYV